jgi:DNA-binding NarL/FixJ family response regulator
MKFLVVDDHPILREGLASLLQQAADGNQVVLASDSAEGLRLAALHADLDLVLLDLAMPGMDGMRAIAAFGQQRPALPVVVLSSSEDPEDVHSALSAGALGYVPKSAPAHTLLAALNLVLAGEVYVPPLLLNRPRHAVSPTAGAEGPARLTERQIEVLRLLSAGESNKEIGLKLGLSEKTVKAHVTAIFRSLHVVNRTQAASAARKAGF